jgi:hypothetical protein
MKKLSCVRAFTADANARRPCTTGETRHPARSRLSVNWKSEPEAVRRVPYTRLAAGQLGRRPIYGPLMCSFQGIVRLTGALLVGCLFGQSKRLQSLCLFTNHSDVGLIFHHSLFAFFGTLFLSETCFGTGSGLIRFGCQCRLPFGDQATFAAMDQSIHRSSSSYPALLMFILEDLNPSG